MANVSEQCEEDNYFVRELEKNDGSVLKVNQCLKGDVGHVVWDAAIVLGKYLETESFLNSSSGVSFWTSKNVLELGAGTGIVGLVAATLGAHVILTDLDDLQQLLQKNITENQALITGSATAKVLRWGENTTDVLPPPDVILMADCIYYEQSVEPLVETLKALAEEKTCIICCYEQRTEGVNPEIERRFFERLLQHFQSEEIPPDKQDPEFNSPEIRLLHLHLK
ncbi:protein N-lysine methyltransferase METTL21D-like [Alosa pseudoharengus]|uniref:protein N-lysine methyltransferase METTL21D-like n=1 Tax=Alosa pseudoharengus TaxID=34774 RepID=UPI003F88FFE4